MKTKNVIFDIGNVLADWDWPGYLHRLFSDEEAIRALTKAYWDNGLWSEMDRGAMKQESIYRELLASAPGFEKEVEESYRRIGECIEQFPYTKPWITSLKEKGYRVFYLSNYSDYLIKENPAAVDFTELCDGGIFSCYVKLIKPDLAIYDALCKKYDLIPGECLFIDDRYINVVGAREYGMKAVQFTGYEEGKYEAFLEN